jgi:hypothetical protein
MLGPVLIRLSTAALSSMAPYTGVVAQPQAIPAAGVSWVAFVSADDTVTIRFDNPTVSDVTVGTINFDLWLIR